LQFYSLTEQVKVIEGRTCVYDCHDACVSAAHVAGAEALSKSNLLGANGFHTAMQWLFLAGW
jgi:hypothetical protein